MKTWHRKAVVPISTKKLGVYFNSKWFRLVCRSPRNKTIFISSNVCNKSNHSFVSISTSLHIQVAHLRSTWPKKWLLRLTDLNDGFQLSDQWPNWSGEPHENIFMKTAFNSSKDISFLQQQHSCRFFAPLNQYDHHDIRGKRRIRTACLQLSTFEVWASSTNLTICDNVVSWPTWVASTNKEPFWLMVPPITGSSGFFKTGMDSPVISDSSVVDVPWMTLPSTGILAPGATCQRKRWFLYNLPMHSVEKLNMLITAGTKGYTELNISKKGKKRLAKKNASGTLFSGLVNPWEGQVFVTEVLMLSSSNV